MEKTKTSAIMQNIAVGIYGLFIIEELFSNYALFARNFTLENWTLTHLMNFLIISIVSVFTVWLFSNTKAVGVFLKKAVISTSCIFILYNIISYSAQGILIDQSISMIIPSQSGKLSVQLFVVAFRLLLLILAAFFIISAVDEQLAYSTESSDDVESGSHNEENEEAEETEETENTEEINEEIVETETERTRRLN